MLQMVVHGGGWMGFRVLGGMECVVCRSLVVGGSMELLGLVVGGLWICRRRSYLGCLLVLFLVGH